ncbi:MAG: ABC transporter ATP-binding protein, partial [Anaerolineae bacterium]
MKIELREIRKYFGPVRANDGITLTLEEGTIHGLLGENGAGKTTLMKVLAGYLTPDGGQIVLNDTPAHFSSPADAIDAGIGMLHQDPLDFPSMTVLDNFMLGHDTGLRQNRARALTNLLHLSQRFDFPLDAQVDVGRLTVGERQQLEILRLMSLGIQVLILDEPTTGISADQKAALFDMLRQLAHRDRNTIVFVSHKLDEVQDLCDEVTVLRRGQVAGRESMPCPVDRLVQLMFGQVFKPAGREHLEFGPPALELRDLTVQTGRVTVPNVNLDVRTGEVIGLAGLLGSGQRPVLQACVGLLRPLAGQVILDSQDMTGQPYHRFVQRGVAYVPAGRLEEGLIAGLTLTEHCLLAEPPRGFVIDWPAARQMAATRIQHFHVVGEPDTPIEALSGGNQQRMLLALLPASLRLLLIEEPTRGLDVESAEWIWTQLLERRRQGTAILFTSADLDEIMGRSDRIVVFSGGRVTGVLDAAETSVDELGRLIGGQEI